MVRLIGLFLISAWAARYLGPSQYGVLAFGQALVATFAFAVSLGVESLVVRDLVQRPDHESEILSTYMAVRAVGGIVAVVLACGYVLLVEPDMPGLLTLTAVLSLGPVFSVMELIDCALQARCNARLSSLTRAMAFAASSLVRCALILSKADLVWFAVAAIVENLVAALIYAAVIRRLGIQFSWRFVSPKGAYSFLYDGRYMILSGATVIIYSKIDVIMLGTLLPPNVVASYSLAASMLAAWGVLGLSFTQAMAPHVASAHARSQSEYLGVLRRLLLASTGISLVGSFCIAASAPIIFHYLLGPAYAQGADVLQVLIWTSVPSFLGMATSQIIVSERLYNLSMWRTAAGMAFSLALVVPMVTRYGPMGVAWLVMLSSWVATLSMLVSPRARQIILVLLMPARPLRGV